MMNATELGRRGVLCLESCLKQSRASEAGMGLPTVTVDIAH